MPVYNLSKRKAPGAKGDKGDIGEQGLQGIQGNPGSANIAGTAGRFVKFDSPVSGVDSTLQETAERIVSSRSIKIENDAGSALELTLPSYHTWRFLGDTDNVSISCDGSQLMKLLSSRRILIDGIDDGSSKLNVGGYIKSTRLNVEQSTTDYILRFTSGSWAGGLYQDLNDLYLFSHADNNYYMRLSKTDGSGRVNGNWTCKDLISDNINSGNYIPILTPSVNIASITSYEAKWSRNGKIVSVNGSCVANANAVGGASFAISLPIASNLSAQDLSGIGVDNYLKPSRVTVDGANNRALVAFDALYASPIGHNINFQFKYEIK